MPALTKKQTFELNEIVLCFLRGEAIPVVRVRLQNICADLETGCEELYKSIGIEPSDNSEISPIVQTLFNHFNIKEGSGHARQLLDKSGNLHQLLIHVCHDGHRELEYLLHLIADTKPPRNWPLIFLFGSMLTAGLGSFFHYNKAYLEAAINWLTKPFPLLINWIGKTFSLLRNTPLLGMIFTSTSLVWNWRDTLSNGTKNTTDKISSLFFKTLTAGLSITGYFLTYLAEGAMQWPAASLFVLGSSMQVFQSLFTFHQNNNALKSLNKPNDSQDWYQHATYERTLNFRQRSMQSVWVKLTAAVLTTLAVGIWNFFPPSLLTTVSCIAFMSLISLTKQTMLSAIEESYAHRLQKAIRNIEIPLPPELQPREQMALDAISQERRQLAREQEQIAAERTDLLQEKEALQAQKEANHLKEMELAAWKRGIQDGLQAAREGFYARRPRDLVSTNPSLGASSGIGFFAPTPSQPVANESDLVPQRPRARSCSF